MNARQQYKAAWRYVRQVNNPQWRRQADNTGLSLSMIWQAYRSRLASWRVTLTARIHADGRIYNSEDAARRVARAFYRAGF